MTNINNGESGSLVRSKLNAVLGNVELIATPAALVADTAFTYTANQARTVTVGSRIMAVEGGHMYQVVAADAATFDLQTAGGVRVLLLPNGSGWYDFDGMAPFKDGVTDNLAKLQKLLDKRTFVSGEGWTGPSINFAFGRYAFSATINLKCICRLYGYHTGFGNNRGTDFLFPGGVAGIIVNRHNTIDDQELQADTGGADASEIVGIRLICADRGSTFDPTKSGIWMRARAFISRCVIRNFAGHGVWAGAGSDGNPYLGNCNLFRVDRIWVQLCRGSAFCAQGTDANAGSAYHVDGKDNLRYCVEEVSFLGNYHFGHHSESNQMGSYFAQNQSALFGAYAEDGVGGEARWNGPQIGNTITAINSAAIGAVLVAEHANGPVGLRNRSGGFVGTRGDTLAHLGTEDGTIMSGRHTLNTNPFRVGVYQGTNAEDVVFRWGSSVNNLVRFGSPTTTFTFGRSAAVGEHINIASLFLGFNNNARNLSYAAAAPTTGNWARGDIVFNNAPSAGGKIGWVCTTAGTPGTWKAWGDIDP